MHVALRVHDVRRSIDFYTAFLGLEPTKVRADYAKFTLASPPLVLSLSAAPGRARHSPEGTGALSHLGFQVAGERELAEARERIARAGLGIALDERGVTCCYAVQNKFWVTDPDGNAWELYRFVEDAASSRGADPTADAGSCCATPSVSETGACETGTCETGAC